MSREEKANIDTVRCRKVLVSTGLAVSLPFCTTVLNWTYFLKLLSLCIAYCDNKPIGDSCSCVQTTVLSFCSTAEVLVSSKVTRFSPSGCMQRL